MRWGGSAALFPDGEDFMTRLLLVGRFSTLWVRAGPNDHFGL